MIVVLDKPYCIYTYSSPNRHPAVPYTYFRVRDTYKRLITGGIFGYYKSIANNMANEIVKIVCFTPNSKKLKKSL